MRIICVQTVGLLLAVSSAWAGTGETATDRPVSFAILDGSACPEIFAVGDVTTSDVEVESVTWETHAVRLTHAGSYDAPELIDYRGLELVETDIEDEKAPTAVVDLLTVPASVPCEPGPYRVEVGDTLGDRAWVVAIVDGLILLEREGELRYLTTAEVEVPAWRMVFHPPWHFSRPVSGTPSRPAPNKRNRRAR